jgi:dethiobiotin synthetase
MSVVFVTGTGTGIGKTFVSTALIGHFKSTGRPIHAIKPVVSGFDEAAWQESDPAVLLAALERPVTLQEVERLSPWRFAAPLSPDIAARREGRAIVFQHLVEFCRKAGRSCPLLIEGIGGIMVPLDDHRSVLDWMSVLRVPIVLVTGTYVGTISHTLTALEVVARRNLDIAAVVVSESQDSAASLADTVTTLARFADVIPVIGIPRLLPGAFDHPAVGQLAELVMPVKRNQ